MKVVVLYTNKSKYTRSVMDPMARWAKTYARSIDDFANDECADLLVLGFDDTLFKEKELMKFIHRLDRQHIKNIALIDCFYKNNHKLNQIIQLCQKNDLPLMRDHYSFQMTVHELKKYKKYKKIDTQIVNGARSYIEDMIHIIQNYY